MSRVSLNAVQAAFQNAFAEKCIAIFLLGYRRARQESLARPDWIENNFSAYLVFWMNRLPATERAQMIIGSEDPAERTADEFHAPDFNANEGPRIDITFHNWENGRRNRFHIEAKNLSERSWRKPNGSKVDARAYQNRYIATGIDHFISGRYRNGCLAAYVVQGDPQACAEQINALLDQQQRAPERLGSRINPQSGVLRYRSQHPGLTLDHLFLTFAN
ncbi:MAG: hypothetical protein AAGN35_08340 [Bacteroidota bacterium]